MHCIHCQEIINQQRFGRLNRNKKCSIRTLPRRRWSGSAGHLKTDEIEAHAGKRPPKGRWHRAWGPSIGASRGGGHRSVVGRRGAKSRLWNAPHHRGQDWRGGWYSRGNQTGGGSLFIGPQAGQGPGPWGEEQGPPPGPACNLECLLG
jgi:hypothetical protein